MFDIDLQSRTPIYEQLYKKIVELSMKQVLKQNDQLPSVRALAKELGVNPNTVSKAYTQLEHDGMVYSLAGRGSFIAASSAVGEKISQKVWEDFDTAVKNAFEIGIAGEALKERVDAAKFPPL